MIDRETWKKAWALLDEREKRNAWIILGIIVVAAMSSAAMIGSVMPFLTVLADPSRIEQTPALSWAYKAMGFSSVYGFLVGLGVGSFAVIVLSSLMQIVRTWATAQFAMMRMHSISSRLLSVYLGQPYAFFLDRHSGEMGPRILTESGQVVQQFLRPAAELIAASLSTLAIVGLLFWVEPFVASIVFVVMGGSYALTFLLTRPILKRLGYVRVAANRARFRMAYEALAGIKAIRLLGREDAYLVRYKEQSREMSQSQVRIDILKNVPQFALQAVTLGGVILLCLAQIDPARIGSETALGGLLPVLGTFAFAGQRLMPELSKIYQSLAQLQAGSAAVNAIHQDLIPGKNTAELSTTPNTELGLKKELHLDNISFVYPNADRPSLRDISISIRSGEKIGIVGSTGSGKTTLADIILGLLEPTSGKIYVDGTAIDAKNRRTWMQSMGYIPQDIFLADASIEENIALGTSPTNIDFPNMLKAAQIAQIDKFVLEELPEGYQTYIGERGVRLSGGQRQRIGIARALYHDADLIVFDEATSALDNLTEKEVMHAIDGLSGNKTVLIIAHRLTTVKTCDRIVVLDKGRIAGFDDWHNLMESNSAFQRIASMSEAL